MLIARCLYETSINYSIWLRLDLIFTLYFAFVKTENSEADFLLFHIFTLCTQLFCYENVACTLSLFDSVEMIHFALFHFTLPCFSVENEKIKNLCIYSESLCCFCSTILSLCSAYTYLRTRTLKAETKLLKAATL